MPEVFPGINNRLFVDLIQPVYKVARMPLKVKDKDYVVMATHVNTDFNIIDLHGKERYGCDSRKIFANIFLSGIERYYTSNEDLEFEASDYFDRIFNVQQYHCDYHKGADVYEVVIYNKKDFHECVTFFTNDTIIEDIKRCDDDGKVRYASKYNDRFIECVTDMISEVFANF